MKTRLFFLAVWTSLFLFAASLSASDFSKPDKEGFVSIFNGADLTGWEGGPDAWRVEDGVIIGESTPEKPCKKTHYLYWTEKEPDNFHLKLTFRLRGESANSGIQFRSEKRPNWDTFGYQADVDQSLQWTGCLFHHTRGAVVQRGFDNKIAPDGKVEVHQIADGKKLVEVYKPNDWNEYEVIADGSVLTLIINGKQMCRVDDRHATESAQSGVLALQMHQGAPMKVEFKDIRIKLLPKEKDSDAKTGKE
ncbi:MAG: DUF1080 domain-containing protein [Planctomycetaceae bacterium]|jgi:hypothetical protein|nr:DUF1080 domain-containing protein [Planctomycetaceae bacterium]